MNFLVLASLAIGPGALLLHRTYVRDRHREPAGNVLVYALLGALVVVPAGFLEVALDSFFLDEGGGHAGALQLVLSALLGVALVEELGKRLALHARARSDRAIDEPFDWIVYAVAVSLGFATLENVLYVFQNGAGVGVLRAFTAVPSHALDGTMMGWHLARASQTGGALSRRHRWLAVLEPVAWHGAYDGLLFLANEPAAVPSEPLRTVLMVAWVALIVAQIKVALRRVAAAAREAGAPPPPILVLAGAIPATLRRARARS